MFADILSEHLIKRKGSLRTGFTLIELVVVIIIIGILASIALPTYNGLVEKSRRTEAYTTLKAIYDSQMRYGFEFDVYGMISELDINVSTSGKYFGFGLGPAIYSNGLQEHSCIAEAARFPLASSPYAFKIDELGNITAYGVTIPCFLAGTLIAMADQTQKPIEEIQAGDIVLAFNEDTAKIEPDTVTKVFSDLKEDTYFIINRTLKATAAHPMLSKGKWVEIKDLKVGDTLTNTQGEDVFIFDIAKVEEPVEVYNFETNPLHTYIANGFIVHNKNIVPTCF